MLTAMVIAMLTAITAWWLLVQRLNGQAVDEAGCRSDEPGVGGARLRRRRSGSGYSSPWYRRCFGIFASAYFMRMRHVHGGLEQWAPLAEPSVLWINTLMLVLASGAMQIARNRADRDDFGGVRTLFHRWRRLLTLRFLAGQVLRLGAR